MRATPLNIDGVFVGEPDELGTWALGEAGTTLSEIVRWLSSFDGLEVDPSAEIHPSASVTHSIIGAGVSIYENVVVRNSVVMSGTQIGHASEVARSCVFPGSSIPRFNYVGASVLGSHVRLGGAVSLASRRFDDALVHLSDGSGGDPKLGSIVGARTLIGFACHVNPGLRIGADCVLQPHVDIRRDVPPASMCVLNTTTHVIRRRAFESGPFPDIGGDAV